MKTKNLIITFILASCFCTINAQNYQVYVANGKYVTCDESGSNPLEKLSDNKQITTVFISKALLSMMPTNMNLDIGSVDIKKIAGKIDQMEIYTSGEKEGIQLMKTAMSSFQGNKEYEILMKVKDSNQNVTFYAQKDKDFFKDLVMCVEGDNYVIMRITGTFTSEDIQQIVNGANK